MDKKIEQKVRKCKNVEEVLKLAKDNNYDISKEKAEELFNSIHSNGELSDSELNSVAGGSCSNCPDDSLLMKIEYFSDGGYDHCIFQRGEEVKLNYLYACKYYAKIVKITSRQMVKDIDQMMFNRPPWYDIYYVEMDDKTTKGPYSRDSFYKNL